MWVVALFAIHGDLRSGEPRGFVVAKQVYMCVVLSELGRCFEADGFNFDIYVPLASADTIRVFIFLCLYVFAVGTSFYITSFL